MRAERSKASASETKPKKSVPVNKSDSLLPVHAAALPSSAVPVFKPFYLAWIECVNKGFLNFPAGM